MIAVSALLAVGYLALTFILTSTVTPAYFLILPMAGMAVLLLLVRNLIAIQT